MYEEGLCGKVRRTALISLLLAAFAAITTPMANAASSVTLAWDPSVSGGVAGYNIYYGATSHSFPSRRMGTTGTT